MLIAIAVLRQLRHSAYLAVGWFWFLATLVSVSGIVQVGLQAHADRCMYVPVMGLGSLDEGIAEYREAIQSNPIFGYTHG